MNREHRSSFVATDAGAVHAPSAALSEVGMMQGLTASAGNGAGSARDARSASRDERHDDHDESAGALGGASANTFGPNRARTISRYRSTTVADEHTSSAIRLAPLNDGSEEDCQCARCGSTAVSESCDSCGGAGAHDESDDLLWPAIYPCDWCRGEGGWFVCCSDEAWCNANPMPGREDVKRGAIEWFTIWPREAVAAIDPALLAAPSTCSTPGACAEVGCAGRCGRVGA